MERRILHVDMDAFYAQIEQRDNPKLQGKPVIVGGKSSSRGVVATASYEARKFGVHSAMPMSRAHQLCPDGYYVRPRFDVYRDESEKIMAIFRSYTEHVQPVAFDEAYLDITHLVRRDMPASRIAAFIKRDIFEATRLTCSAGVSYNKFLAKLSSGMNKPDGLTIIHHGNVHDILMKLPIGAFPGVGRVTEEKMKQDGIHTGLDLYQLTERELIKRFGKRGPRLYDYARGIDHSTVKAERIRKSIGKETTFAVDKNDDDEILGIIRQLSQQVSDKLNRYGLTGDVVTVKMKESDFRSTSRQLKLPYRVSDTTDIYNVCYDLYTALKHPDRPIRLIGVTVGNLEERQFMNMTIYDFI
ncbi:DNA polymerase IV [Macrococcus equipercicus]|uniref:DNA polymerase IV n=1 Tax=Macrococcus equipercicus TaxID=69967 RepID=A0A9Q9F0W9_9STAP|nr:DNA polymerase IV [Macrococcus equipercicus]KAA1037696.1 DNA polymerase IV [Macrococcus equipercicus]UTH13408.1 DNA polymerase IV [Macrococcus equipercicus]